MEGGADRREGRGEKMKECAWEWEEEVGEWVGIRCGVVEHKKRKRGGA